MQIKRDGLVFSTAYAFMPISKRPTSTIDGCKLFWRFLLFAPLKIVVNLFFLGFVILFILALPVRVFWTFLVGRKLYLHPFTEEESKDPDTSAWKWFEYIPDSILAVAYGSVPNHDLPRIFGLRIVPLFVLCALAVTGLHVLFVADTVSWLSAAGSIPKFSVIVLLIEIVVGLFALIGVIFIRARDTELWKLITLRYRAFKEQTCPVVEIVD